LADLKIGHYGFVAARIVSGEKLAIGVWRLVYPEWVCEGPPLLRPNVNARFHPLRRQYAKALA
jgi:hypothetical protein